MSVDDVLQAGRVRTHPSAQLVLNNMALSELLQAGPACPYCNCSTEHAPSSAGNDKELPHAALRRWTSRTTAAVPPRELASLSADLEDFLKQNHAARLADLDDSLASCALRALNSLGEGREGKKEEQAGPASSQRRESALCLLPDAGTAPAATGDPTDVAETAQPSLRDTKKACATYATESNVADCSESSSMAAGLCLLVIGSEVCYAGEFLDGQAAKLRVARGNALFVDLVALVDQHAFFCQSAPCDGSARGLVAKSAGLPRKTAMKTAMKKAMKKADSTKRRSMKAKRVTQVARGRLAKSMVFSGKKVKTSGGLTKDGLMSNVRGKIVSKRQSAHGKKCFKHIEGWVEAVMEARAAFNAKGFVAINGKTLQGKALYAKAKTILAQSLEQAKQPVQEP
ncbi:PAT23 [Symbiodinium natans]|uniref:PAT23 protein n=1 Tax=Symbiodinium natans TaxID=878477 RepID=A0A812PMT2_9DINO|nr:PAT23 [Symbiodinium natans]